MLTLLPYLFQSTLPVRGATSRGLGSVEHIAISIHAPREGSDYVIDPLCDQIQEISIHAPREGSDL